jgi:hypothetical protein
LSFFKTDLLKLIHPSILHPLFLNILLVRQSGFD